MRAAVIDFETTGLPKRQQRFDVQPCITQIACVVVDDDLNEIQHYQSMINPDVDPSHWEAEAIKVTGIKPEDVLDAPTYFLAHHDFASCVLGCDYWVGFNPEFDREVLWWQLQRVGFEKDFPWPPKVLDVMALAKRRLELQGRQGTKTPNLGEAHLHLVGRKLENAHDALADVRGTIDVWRKCK